MPIGEHRDRGRSAPPVTGTSAAVIFVSVGRCVSHSALLFAADDLHLMGIKPAQSGSVLHIIVIIIIIHRSAAWCSKTQTDRQKKEKEKEKHFHHRSAIIALSLHPAPDSLLGHVL